MHKTLVIAFLFLPFPLLFTSFQVPLMFSIRTFFDLVEINAFKKSSNLIIYEILNNFDENSNLEYFWIYQWLSKHPSPTLLPLCSEVKYTLGFEKIKKETKHIKWSSMLLGMRDLIDSQDFEEKWTKLKNNSL